MSDKYIITYGKIMGRDHLSRQMNRQDALRVLETDKFVVGVVCDGCGSGHFSEVGANIVCDYVCRQAMMYAERGLSIDRIPHWVAIDVISALKNVMVALNAKDQDAIDYLLTTINGIILNKRTGEAVIFNNGDGVLVDDNYIHEIDQKNAPRYLSYALIQPNYEAFNVYHRTNWKRLGVFTDGIEIDKIDDLFDCRSPLQLQRKLNVLSKFALAFKDDLACFLIRCVED